MLVWAFYGVHAELAKPTLEGALRSWCPPLVAGALAGVAALMSALLGAVVTVRLVRLAAMHGRGLREDAGAGGAEYTEDDFDKEMLDMEAMLATS